MGKGCVLALIVAVAVLARFHGVEGWMPSAGKEFYIGGEVLCQDCTKGWNEWAKESEPIKGATVAVTCVDKRNRVVYHASYVTDDQGVFELTVPASAANGELIKPENCLVRVVKSPAPKCNVMTDSGGGKSGVKLYRPSVVYGGLLKFTTEPFYFTSPMCADPES